MVWCVTCRRKNKLRFNISIFDVRVENFNFNFKWKTYFISFFSASFGFFNFKFSFQVSRKKKKNFRKFKKTRRLLVTYWSVFREILSLRNWKYYLGSKIKLKYKCKYEKWRIFPKLQQRLKKDCNILSCCGKSRRFVAELSICILSFFSMIINCKVCSTFFNGLL